MYVSLPLSMSVCLSVSYLSISLCEDACSCTDEVSDFATNAMNWQIDARKNDAAAAAAGGGGECDDNKLLL